MTCRCMESDVHCSTARPRESIGMTATVTMLLVLLVLLVLLMHAADVDDDADDNADFAIAVVRERCGV